MTMTKVWQHRGQFAPGGLTQIKGPIYWARILRAFVSPATDNGTGYLSSPGAAWREIGSTQWNPIYGRDVYHPLTPNLQGLEICGMSADIEYCTDDRPMDATDYSAHDGWDLLVCNTQTEASGFIAEVQPQELSGNMQLGCSGGAYTFDCTQLLGVCINAGNGTYNMLITPYDDTLAPVTLHPAGTQSTWATIPAGSLTNPTATRAFWGFDPNIISEGGAVVAPITKVYFEITSAPTNGFCRFYLYGKRRG
jgi:hypothetical protein